MQYLTAILASFLPLIPMTQQDPKPDPRAFLRQLTGEWEITGEVWRGDGSEPMPSSGKGKSRVLLGKHTRLDLELEMMGFTMNWEMTLGYDSHAKHFDFTLLTNVSESTVRATGRLSGRQLEFKGRMSDPRAGDRVVRHTLEKKGENLIFATFDTLPDGKEFQVMEIALKPKAD